MKHRQQVWKGKQVKVMVKVTEKIKENTHIVIKREDVYKYLAEPELISLEYILSSIGIGRARDGKKQGNTYYICNTDEPYSAKVLEVILNQGNDWIPCSERLPETWGKYLVTCEDIEIPQIRFFDGEWDSLKNVIAWQPLSEVYQPPATEKHIKNKRVDRS